MADEGRQNGERVGTHVPGLDEVLGGGFLRGSTHLVLGPPGSGKTVLAAQVAFGHVGGGGRAIYMTLLSEPQGQLVSHLSHLSFFREEAVGGDLYFVSGYGELAEGGTDALIALLRRLIRDRKASLLILDGLPLVEMLAESPASFQRFLHELHALVTITTCTTVLLAATPNDAAITEAAQFDGLLHLEDHLEGLRASRSLHVAKLRGSDFLRGRHAFEIDARGIVVVPRLESTVRRRVAPAEVQTGRAAFGVEGLDALLGGGLRRGTTGLLLGPSGTGKTLLGLAFLADGAAAGEAGLYYGLSEPEDVVRTKAEGVGLGLSSEISVLVEPPVEVSLDAFGARLLAAVRERGVRRVVLDGLGALGLAVAEQARLEPFMSALVRLLQDAGATTLVTLEQGLDGTVPVRNLSGFAQHLVLLRHAESGGRLRRILSVVGVASGEHDPVVRELKIGEGKLRLGRTYDVAVSPATGFAHARPAGEGER